jgi:hypothetical protein
VRKLLNELQSRSRELKLANYEAEKPGASDKAKATADEAGKVFIAFRERIRPIINETGTLKDKNEFAKWESPRMLRSTS